MSIRKRSGILVSACILALANAWDGAAICGIPNIYGVNTPPAPVGFTVLYSPIAPFPPTGIAFVGLGVPFGDAAYQTILAAGTSVPPKFMQIIDPPPPGPPSQCSGLCV